MELGRRYERKGRIKNQGREWRPIKDSEKIKSNKGRAWGGKVVSGQSLPYYLSRTTASKPDWTILSFKVLNCERGEKREKCIPTTFI